MDILVFNGSHSIVLGSDLLFATVYLYPSSGKSHNALLICGVGTGDTIFQNLCEHTKCNSGKLLPALF